jgi:hypothetical protein
VDDQAGKLFHFLLEKDNSPEKSCISHVLTFQDPFQGPGNDMAVKTGMVTVKSLARTAFPEVR